MLQNAYFLAKIGADIAENEQHFAEILRIGRRVAGRRSPPAPRGSSAAAPPGARRFGLRSTARFGSTFANVCQLWATSDTLAGVVLGYIEADISKYILHTSNILLLIYVEFQICTSTYPGRVGWLLSCSGCLQCWKVIQLMQRGVAYGKEAPLCPLECDFHSMVAYIPIRSFFETPILGT